jgi:hypothetical protein
MRHDYEQLARQAKAERAVVIGEMIGDAYNWIVKIPARIRTQLATSNQSSPLESCRTPACVLAYARSIEHVDPGFARDLYAAVGRTE